MLLYIRLFLAICVLLLSATVHAEDTADLKISVEQNNVFLETLLPPLLKEAGLRANIVSVPSKRALKELNSGKIDANGLRLRILEDHYQNIIRMNEPVMNIDFIAITNRDDVHIQNWADLKQYRVAYPAGWKIFDVNVPDETSLMRVNKHDQLFGLLNIKRVDVVLLSRTIANTLMKHTYVPDLRFLSPPLHRTPAYLFFHQSKQPQAEQLAAALRRLKQNGIYGTLYRDSYKY